MNLTGMLFLEGWKWPLWIGGYSSWSQGMNPMANSFKFFADVEELRSATMLEF